MHVSSATHIRWKRSCSALLHIIVVLLGGLFGVGHAQITMDGSLGPGGAAPGYPNYTIPHDKGQIRGANLFHSFGEFNVQSGESVTFKGPSTIANIVARVTGGGHSYVNGKLRSSISGANLYFFNPNGVMFGPNADVSLSGSFHVSTADFVRFADGVTFPAQPQPTEVLTVAPPASFGFLANNAGRIDISGGALRVGERKELSVTAGEIRINQRATLRAPSGRIQLVSIDQPEKMLSIPVGAAQDLPAASFARAGPLQIVEGSRVEASGSKDPGSSGAGGRVVIRSGRLTMDGAASVRSDTLAGEDGDPLAIDVHASERAVLSNGSELRVRPQGDGQGGSIVVTAPVLTLRSGSRIFTTTSGAKSAGDITVEAAESVSIAGADVDGRVSGLFANSSGVGDAGRVLVTTATLDVRRGHIEALADKDSSGKTGTIDVHANNVTVTAGARFTTTSSVGNSATPQLPEGVGHSASNAGEDQTGSLRVTASEALSIAGADPRGNVSGLFANTTGLAHAGKVRIKARTLEVRRGHIEALADSDSQGNAGSVDVHASRLTMAGGAQINTSSRGQGSAGMLLIDASDAIAIEGKGEAQSGLFSDTAGSGDAGQVRVATRMLSMNGGRIEAVTQEKSTGRAGQVNVVVENMALTDGAEISTTTRGAGAGGELMIRASDKITLTTPPDSPMTLVAANTGSSGNAGSVSMFANTLELDGAEIQSLTDTDSTGEGGSVSLNVDSTTLRRGAQISVSTRGAGKGGTLNITASGTVTIGGSSSNGSSALFSTANLVAAGDGGHIQVRAGRIDILDGGLISVISQGSGKAGTISLQASDKLRAVDGSVTTSTLGNNSGGDIEVTAREIELRQGTSISASSRGGGTGAPGNVKIQFGDRFLLDDSSISTESRFSEGGDIAIFSTGSILLLNSGRITTSVQGGRGGGGNIDLGLHEHPLGFVILNNSAILARAFGGPGGNIAMLADVYLTSSSAVDASSRLSTPGLINVEARITDVSAALAKLPEDVLQAAQLLKASCSGRVAQSRASSLVVDRREGLPPEPGGVLRSPLSAVADRAEELWGELDNAASLAQLGVIWSASACAR